MLWNCFCVVWVGVVYRGRTVPIHFNIVVHKSSTVGLWQIQRVLRPVSKLLPMGTEVVLLADRGFADGKLMKYLQQNLKWHFRIRIKQRFQFQSEGRWYKVSDVQPKRGKAYFTGPVTLGKTKPYWHRGMSYLKIGWNWIRRAITDQCLIPIFHYLSSAPDPDPAIASKRQHERSFTLELTVLKHMPAS